MSRFVRAALLATLVALAWAGTPAAQAPRTRLYLTFTSHNDMSSTNLPCRWVGHDQARFATNRAALVSLAGLVVSKGGAYDMQTDWEYIQRVSQWETAAQRSTTGGRNVLQYLASVSPDHIAVDAHSHEQGGYNYADVAYLLTTMGVPSTGIVGGFLAAPVSVADWERFRAPLAGLRYPQYRWTVDALWGGGSPLHTQDPKASGMWRPKSHAEFHTDAATQALVNIGAYSFGSHDPSGAVDVLTRLYANTLAPNRMYTASLMLNQCELDSNPGILAWVSAVLDAAAPYVARGDVVWATLPNVLRAWREDYGSQASILVP